MTLPIKVAEDAYVYMEPNGHAMKKKRWQVSAKLSSSPESLTGQAEANDPDWQDLESTILPTPLPFRKSVHMPSMLFC